MTYDQAGRLETATLDGVTAQYLYNAQGQRARKDVGTAGTIFHYDHAGHLIAETGTGSNLLIKREYVWLEDIPLAFGKIAQRPEEITDNPGATVSGAWTATTSASGFYGADYLSHAPAGAPAGTVILDDLNAVLDELAQTEVTFTGVWVPMTATPAGYYGPGYFRTLNANQNDSFTWKMSTTPGRYSVYVRWPTGGSERATNAPYTVTHTAGTSEVRFNQRQGGGRWQLHGTYDFDTQAIVKLTGTQVGPIVADAVRLVPVTGANADTAHWEAPDAATYDVFVRWPAAINHSTLAPFTIHHASGSNLQLWNQGHPPYGSTWNHLGQYTFDGDPGQGVTLGTDPDNIVAADAVRFVPTNASLIKESDSYFHVDHLNTPQKLTDEDQRVVWDASYEPFGELASLANDYLIEQPLRFSGQYFDQETELHQNWWRDYEPGLARYLQSDPMGLEFEASTYSYARQNPLVHTDPLGLFTYNAPPPTTVPVSRHLEKKVLCLEDCLKVSLVITGGAEKTGHNPGSAHYSGQAVDFSRKRNPSIFSPRMERKFFCCAVECGFKYGEKERHPVHYHLQTRPGTKGGSGRLTSDGCECSL